MGVVGGVPPTARNLAAMVDNIQAVPAARTTGPSSASAGSSGRSISAALALGGSIRVGLEDNFYLPDGTMARSNGDLVAKAREMVVGRRPAPRDRRRGARAARPARAHRRLTPTTAQGDPNR